MEHMWLDGHDNAVPFLAVASKKGIKITSGAATNYLIAKCLSYWFKNS